jgi:hypothetical protein
MLIVLQFPFADLRGFIGPSADRLKRPGWPLASPESDFVRSVGLVRQRSRGGDVEWAGEEMYCDAHSSFRFPNRLRAQILGSAPTTGVATRAMRRFYSNGTMSRIEVGLRVDIEGDRAAVTPESTIRLIQSCVEIPILTNGHASRGLSSALAKPQNRGGATPLIQAGAALARLLVKATSKRRNGVTQNPQSWWVVSGAPTILVENLLPLTAANTPANPTAAILSQTGKPPHSTQLHSADSLGVAISHGWLQFGPTRCSTWFVSANAESYDALRRVRIHLLRLHAERECLRKVLLSVNDGTLALSASQDVSDAIQDYLNDTLQVIQRPKRAGLSQSPMFDVAREALDSSLQGQAASFNLMRRQVAAKIKRYVDRANATATVINNIYGSQMNTTIQLGNVTVTGDFNIVTAKRIENSFNKTSEAGVPDALKRELQELVVKVAQLTKVLPADHAEKAAQDLETLTSEATSKTPRKRWYELSAEGLIDAAKTVAAFAAPITQAVQAVLALIVV